MDLFDRIFCLHQIFSRSRYPVTSADIQERLECSRATFNRMIRDMRNYLGAPIEYDRKTAGYYYAATGEHPYELPGLWFNASELHALLTVQQLLSETQPGLLERDNSNHRFQIQFAKETVGVGYKARRRHS